MDCCGCGLLGEFVCVVWCCGCACWLICLGVGVGCVECSMLSGAQVVRCLSGSMMDGKTAMGQSGITDGLVSVNETDDHRARAKWSTLAAKSPPPPLNPPTKPLHSTRPKSPQAIIDIDLILGRRGTWDHPSMQPFRCSCQKVPTSLI